MASSVNKESLFKDILDDDLINVFRPINYAQRLLGFCRVDIKYNFVTGSTTLSQFYGSLIIVVNFISQISFIVTTRIISKSPSTSPTLKLGMILNVIVTNLVLWRINFLNGNLNVELYIKLQRIERFLNMKNKKHINKMHFISNLFFMILGLLSTAIWITVLNVTIMDKFYVTLYLALFPGLGVFIEAFLACQMMLFITIRVNHINKCLRNEIMIKQGKLKKHYDRGNKAMWSLSNTTLEHEHSSGLVLGMHNVLDALTILKQLFQFEILALFCQFISWDFITMRNLATSLKEQTSVDVNVLICNVPLLLLITVNILMISFMGNALTVELKTTKKLCINMSSCGEEKARKSANQILFMMGEDSCDVSIYDIFTLNTQLPLNLFVITANYTMVFLQFAML